MRKSKKAALIIIMSSVYLAGCNAAGGGAAADPSAAVSQEVTEPGAETISPEILEALESKTVDVKGYYIRTNVKSSGERTETERDKEYKGDLKEIEVIEQAGEIVIVKAYLVDREEFFTTAEKAELEYNAKNGSIEIKTDKMKIEPTVFFDISMFFENKIYAANDNRELEKLPEMTEDNIKEIVIMEALEGELITQSNFYYNGYVQFTDKEDHVFLCAFYLYYKPHEKELYSKFTREWMEKNQSPVWDIKLVSVKK